MVNVLVDISERANRVLAIVKAKYGLRTKAEAIEKMADEYEEDLLEPELRPEFIEEMKKLEKEKHKAIPVKDFAKRYGLK